MIIPNPKGAYMRALNNLLTVEGHEINDSDDPGGQTVFGIARNYWPQWYGLPHQTRGVPTYQDAVDFYMQEFWRPLRIGEYGNELLQQLVFFAAVNPGMRRAGMLLQESLNDLGEKLVVDGVVGAKTLDAVRRWVATEPKANALCGSFLVSVGQYFKSPERSHPKYRPGWLGRRLLWPLKHTEWSVR